MQTTQNPVGARLAREEAGTSSIDVGCHAAIAGKPAPTGDGGDLEILAQRTTARFCP
ncbi:hypothetical protein EMIT0P44_630009 [Pseudomonas sp. IT-P44]